MMLRLTALALLASSALGYESFNLQHPSAQKLLSKATVIEPARNLADNDYSYLYKYSIKYLGCTDLVQINRDQDGGNNNNGGNSLLYTQHLVKFALCPSSDGCGTCTNGGQYVADMMDFVDAYTEAKLTEQEYKCEMIRENCYCNGYNDDQACANSCYMQAGMDVCIEYEGQEEFEIQRYLECAEMEAQNGNNNNNNNNQNYYNNQNGFYGQYYIAPYCANDGASIYLGVYYDQYCMNKADDSVYGSSNYGATLPYSDKSLVIANDCIACQDVDNDNNNNNNNNGNNNYNYDVTELCENTYMEAAKCETNMGLQYPDTSGCTFINDILPRMEKSISTNSKAAKSSGGGAATAFAWVFGISTVLFGAYAYFLYRKIKRGSVNLSSQEATMA